MFAGAGTGETEAPPASPRRRWGAGGARPRASHPGQSRGAAATLLQRPGRWFQDAEVAAAAKPERGRGGRLRPLHFGAERRGWVRAPQLWGAAAHVWGAGTAPFSLGAGGEAGSAPPSLSPRYRGSLRDTLGDDGAAAVFILSCGGGGQLSPCPLWGCPPAPLGRGGLTLNPLPHPPRFEGQQHWTRGGARGPPEVLSFPDVPVVAPDFSGSSVTWNGLDNLGEPRPLPGTPRIVLEEALAGPGFRARGQGQRRRRAQV